MNIERLARGWIDGDPQTAPQILAAIMPFDDEQLDALRESVQAHPQLTNVVSVIDGFRAFQQAKQKLDDAKTAAEDMAHLTKVLMGNSEFSSTIATTSLQRAQSAQNAASDAMKHANSKREKIDAAVVLELAQDAVKQAHDAAEAANQLTVALNKLARATRPPSADDQHS